MPTLRGLVARDGWGDGPAGPPDTITQYPVTLFPRPIRVVLLVLAASAAAAQTPMPAPVHPAKPTAVTIAKPTLGPRARPKARVRPQQPPFDPDVIVLDAAHGGSDTGAKLGGAGDEKDLNVAFADRLKSMLEAQQFRVVLTHASADDDPTPDQRAETANRARAVACLLLHATNSGHGVHLFSSALTATVFHRRQHAGQCDYAVGFGAGSQPAALAAARQRAFDGVGRASGASGRQPRLGKPDRLAHVRCSRGGDCAGGGGYVGRG